MYIESLKIHEQFGSTQVDHFYCGDVIKMQLILNIDTADSVTIKVVDPCLAKRVDWESLTKQVDGVYEYYFQSHESGWMEGDYIITVKVNYNGYTDVIQDTITLHWQEPFGTVV
jgi:hypothetical protein